jgi:hypothetical protein
MHSLGWHISLEAADDDDLAEDPKLQMLESRSVLARPASSTPMYQVDKYGIAQTKYADRTPAVSSPVEQAIANYIGISPTHYHSLLHGSVLGVPIGGGLGSADDKPSIDDIATAVGLDLDDVTAALAAPGFGVDDSKRHAAERLMAAFTGDLLNRISTPDGVRDIEEREHADGFWSFAGKPVPGSQDDRLRAADSMPLGPNRVGRKGRGAIAPAGGTAPGGTKGGIDTADMILSDVKWKQQYVKVQGSSSAAQAKPSTAASEPPLANADPTASRTVPKPPPRMFRPAPALVAVRGLKPSSRHHGDGMFDADGLKCRWPDECKPGFEGVVNAGAILPSLGNGAIPGEVLRVVQEAVTLDPYASTWLGKAGAPEPEWGVRVARVKAEHIRLYGDSMIYDGAGTTSLLRMLDGGPHATAGSWEGVSQTNQFLGMSVAQELAKFSYYAGSGPSPVALTTWRQPWVPLYVEWRVRLTGHDTLAGWQLTNLDLERDGSEPPADDVDATFVGRSPISTGIGKALGTAMTAWLTTENARDAATPSQSQLSEDDELALARLRDLIAPLDLVSLSLDGIREQLLGIDYVNGAIVRDKTSSDAAGKPTASRLPTPLFGGQIELLDLRAVDAFGRVFTIPIAGMRTTQALEVQGKPAAIAVTPRVQHGARWLFRFVDPGHPLTADPLVAPEAYVDQLAGEDAVTPIAGYLLPDHMDESLECFDRFGNPIGELLHDAISDAVTWEPAPGRAVPPDAGPLIGIPGEFAVHAQHIGLLAAGLMRADVTDRHSGEPATRSALSALLRAIDSTLWSIDTFQSIGSPTIAGLVGRPVAVVRATLRLDVPDDVDEVSITEVGGPDLRRAAFAALADQRFPVRIGDLGRSDDAVLGFFVDDDYTKFHVVDKVVASQALATGRHLGYLGLLGDLGTPDADPIEHRYLEPEDTLLVQPGQVLRLTVLMLPAGKLHLTTGIVPRKALALPDDWVTPGLRKLVPSLRVGPVLVDPAEIRMPKVASLGEQQNFIRRTGPLTWKEDPIVSATSAAMLPRVPHEAQEGWIRVAPKDPQQGGGQ